MTLREIHRPKKSQPWIYILLLLIIIGAMTGLRLLSGKGSGHYTHIANSDTIRAAVVYGPNSYRVLTSDDGKDSIVGINYHLLRALQDSLGIVVEMYPVIDRDESLSKVASGHYDILASLPADNYLKENFLTSDEVSLDRLVLIQNRSDDGLLSVRSALDLAGDTVHVEKGSAAVRRLMNLKKEIGDSIYIVEEEGLSEEYMVMKVATGAWSYAVVNEKTAGDMNRDYPDLDFSTPVSFTQFQVWVLPRDRDSLLLKVNDFLKSKK
ncbi:MAG: transporter substrate-binding domain-containing protein [Muribaculum sp.]|nr:transporter substrate-binding domain-containing protein [Muribaculum sp.]